jgi:hypothetical protein
MNADKGIVNAAFLEAREDQWVWKTPAMEAMAVAVCGLALKRGMAEEFSANDLADFNHGGQGICGSIFKRLIEDGVLTRVGRIEDGKFCPKIVTNAGGNKIGVYRLASHARASALVKLHSRVLTNAATELKQQDFDSALGETRAT